MGDASLHPKRAAESRVTLAQVMLPEDANSQGHVHGGTIMKLVDTVAAVAAMRHARRRVATVYMDGMSFLSPVFVGNLVTVKAAVNAVWRTSMEVGVRVEAEDLLSGRVTHTSSAYLDMVALDERGTPTPVPPLAVETDEERRRWEAAQERRTRRLRAVGREGV